MSDLPQTIRPAATTPTLRPLRVGFVLLSAADDPAPSTRIACLNLFDHLPALGVQPVLLFEPPSPQEEPDVAGVAARAAALNCDVVVFQKVHGASVLRSLADLRVRGIATVYCICDFVDDAMAAAADRTVAVTAYLRSLYAPQLQHRIDVVHDGIEEPQRCRLAPAPGEQRPLRAAMVTSQALYALPVIGVPPAPWHLEVLGLYPADPRQRGRALRWTLTHTAGGRARWQILRAALHPRVHRTPWTATGVYDALLQADIGVIAIDRGDRHLHGTAPVPSWQTKSENRLTLKMALGLPVVATPIPAYEPVLQHGVNGFFATSRADWLQCLALLRDPALRHEMGQRARTSVLSPFSVERQARLFVQSVRLACAAHLRG